MCTKITSNDQCNGCQLMLRSVCLLSKCNKHGSFSRSQLQISLLEHVRSLIKIIWLLLLMLQLKLRFDFSACRLVLAIQGCLHLLRWVGNRCIGRARWWIIEIRWRRDRRASRTRWWMIGQRQKSQAQDRSTLAWEWMHLLLMDRRISRTGWWIIEILWRRNQPQGHVWDRSIRECLHLLRWVSNRCFCRTRRGIIEIQWRRNHDV